MFAYGIRSNILNWFESSLTNISQFIMYDNIQSETRNIKCGVPQGSILGPLLFVIYMNDICNVSELLYSIMYADDTSVIMRGNDLENQIQSVNSELCLLNIWLKANKLSLNGNKTYYLIFHRARIKVDNDNSIRMNDSIINSASHLKYLGVIIDSKLNWIPHITYVKNKISKGIGIMFKTRDYLNKNCLSNFYHTYIFPYLIYCIEVWGNASHCHLLLLL